MRSRTSDSAGQCLRRFLAGITAGREAGFTAAVVMVLLVVISLLGAVAIKYVNADIKFSGRNMRYVKAQIVAESALHWALGSMVKNRPNVLPFTASTLSVNGIDSLPNLMASGASNPRKLHPSEVTPIYPLVSVYADTGGWIYQYTNVTSKSLGGGKTETIAFRIWYPNDSTIRVTGKGVVDNISATVEMTGKLTSTRIILP